MKDLRRRLWRFKTGAYLREKLSDDFEDAIETLEARGREALRALGPIAEGSTNEARVAREFEGAIGDARQDTRAARFQAALEFLHVAEQRLETIEEILRAVQQIEASAGKLAEIEALVGYKKFVGLEDSYILLLRAREYCQASKYRAARFIAAVCATELTRLFAAAPDEEPVPPGLVKRRDQRLETARTLEECGLGAAEAARIRKTVGRIDRAITQRHFRVAAAMLSDQETADAPIDAFLAQLRLLPEPPSFITRLLGTEQYVDWQGGAAQLAEVAMLQASERVARDARASASGN